MYYAFGSDVKAFGLLAKADERSGAPRAALALQGIVTTIIILSGTLDQIMLYAGFTLTLTTALAVSCVFVLRCRRPGMERPFRTWGYPFTPLLFLILSVWMMVYAINGDYWKQAMMGLATVLGSGVVFFVASWTAGRKS